MRRSPAARSALAVRSGCARWWLHPTASVRCAPKARRRCRRPKRSACAWPDCCASAAPGRSWRHWRRDLAVNALPLAGRRIVVTRPKNQAAGLAALIREAGGEPLEIPALEIRDLADLAPFFAVVDHLDSFDAAIFVSRNAVRNTFALMGNRRWPAHLRVATVGNGSREELESHGIAGVIAPGGRADSEALLAMQDFSAVAGKRIAIFRGEGGRNLLGDTLAVRGALVEHAPCYRRAVPAGGAALLDAGWKNGKVD